MRTTGLCLYTSAFGSSINDYVRELMKKRQVLVHYDSGFGELREIAP